LKFKPTNLYFIQASKLHSELWFKHYSYYSDTSVPHEGLFCSSVISCFSYVKVSFVVFLQSLYFYNLGMKFLLMGRAVTPYVIKMLITFLNS
jgi:hypothetical protein